MTRVLIFAALSTTLALGAWSASAREADAPRTTAAGAQVTLSMYCFWSGQACLAGIDGVVDAEPGFQARREVVRVTFDPETVSRAALIRQAARRDCASAVLAPNGEAPENAALPVRVVDDGFRFSAKDDLHALKGTRWLELDLSRPQALKVNRDVAMRRDPRRWLTPAQRAELESSR